MWSNTDNGQEERCDKYRKGQLGRCDQIQMKVN